MKTRQKAVDLARHLSVRCQAGREYAVYRVGAAWMVTGDSKAVVLQRYRATICDWEVVCPAKRE